MGPTPQDMSDEELFARVSEGRASGRDVSAPLGELIERWRSGALYVIRRVRQSYGKGSPEDDEELLQDAVAKLVERGLDQFRGVSEQLPGKSASPKTFFMRIAKHVAIDRFRRAREVLAEAPAEGEEDESREGAAERTSAVEGSRRQEERAEASELYWAAYRRLQREHPNEASAWDLYHHQDLDDHQEVAKRLGITVTNSYKRVSRAQAYLKAYLLELGGEGG
ncbi:MAG TPA: RNA polymerase sigma factor [Myxococcaceae bacterium]